ncbi:YCF48-related protein [Marinimicrobium sp. C2-29]|uniref:YCF48-related protein n=1 Tax=Marinimicrobium sp. C2-29 TaxID=3139825 RepID=UPI003138F6D3
MVFSKLSRLILALVTLIILSVATVGCGGGGGGGGGGAGTDNGTDTDGGTGTDDATDDDGTDTDDGTQNDDGTDTDGDTGVDDGSDGGDTTDTGSDGQSYSLLSTVSGLSGEVQLLVDGSPVAISDNSTTTLRSSLSDGDSYEVSVEQQPVDQTCVLSNNSGSIGGANETVNLTCSEDGQAFSVVVDVAGLSGGSLELSNGTDTLTLTDNGPHAFPTPSGNAAEYRVVPSRQPEGQACYVSNDRGTVAADNVNDVEVDCEQRDVTLVALQALQAQQPSIVRIPISVRKFDAPFSPLDGLTTEDFTALESGDALTSESFLRVDPITNIPFVFETVLMLDVSSSFSATEIDDLKEIARNFVFDPVTGASKLLENQRVTLRIFDGDIRYYDANFASYRSIDNCSFNGCPGDSSDNVEQLKEAIDAIERGGSSTNLYGAIEHGAGLWSDSFTIDQSTFGAMILVTDGDDTAAISTKENAIAAVADKVFFAVPEGSDVNTDVIEEIAGANNTFPAENLEQVDAIFDDIGEQLARQSDGKYLLYYASPKRSGIHDLLITADSNANTTENFEVTGTFSAGNFSDIDSEREVVITGPERVYFDEPVTWEVSTRWSNDAANYSWDWTDSGSILDVALSDNGVSADIAATGAGTGNISFTVVDENWTDMETSRAIDVRPSRIPQNFSAESGNGAIEIFWDPVQDATQYNLYWSTSPGVDKGNSVIQITQASPFVVEDLTNGTDYYYAMASLIDGVESRLSEEVTAQPRLPAPTGFTLNPGDTQNQLSWDAVEGATAYTLYWNTAGDVTTDDNAISLGSDVTSHSHDLPDPDASYYYRLTASDGTSESLATEETGLPPEPVLATAAGDTAVELSWTEREGETYTLYRSTTEGDSTNGAALNDVTSPYEDTGLANDTTYYYTLAATNTVGGTNSAEVGATPIGPWVGASFSHENLQDMAFANDTLGLAVGAQGHMLRTTNGGADWIAVDTNTSVSLSAVVFVDADNAVAVGSNATALFSIDGGQSWQVASTPATTNGVYDLAVSTEGTLIAVGENGLIWRSTDRGQNWSARGNPDPETDHLVAVTYSAAGKALAMGWHTAIETTDDGVTWKTLEFPFTDSAERIDGLYAEGDRIVAVGETKTQFGRAIGTIVQSEDGGASWNRTNLTGTFRFYDLAFGDALNAKVIGVGRTSLGNAGVVFTTSDGGDTWVEETSGADQVLNVVLSRGGDAYISAGGSDIHRTREGHTIAGPARLLNGWADMERGTANELLSVARIDNQSAVAAGAGGVVLKTQDGGTSWQPQSVSTTEHLYGIAMANTTHGIAVGTNGEALISSDAGQEWSPVLSQTSAHLRAVTFANTQRAVAVGDNGTVTKTENQGVDWAIVDLGETANLRDVYFVDANVGYLAGLGGTAYKTIDGGTSWTQLTNLPVAEDLHSVYFTDSLNGYLVGNLGTLLKTEDGGDSWQDLSPGDYATLNFSSIAVRADGTIKITSDSTGDDILVSTDGGTSFTTEPLINGFYLNDQVVLSNGWELAVGRGGRVVRFLDEALQR